MWYRYVTSSWFTQNTGINSARVTKPKLRSDADQEPDNEFLIFSLVRKVSRKKNTWAWKHALSELFQKEGKRCF